MRRDFILSKVGSKEKHFTFSVALTAIFLVLSNTHGFAQRDFNRQPKGNKPRVNFSLIQYRGGPSVIGIQPRSHLSRFGSPPPWITRVGTEMIRLAASFASIVSYAGSFAA